MRISNFDNFLPGADNLYAIEMLQGEQRIFEGQFVDDDGPINITNFTLETTAVYYTAGIDDSGRTPKYVPKSGVIMDPQPAQSLKLKIIKPEQTETQRLEEGKFTFILPEDLYEGDIEADITTNVPVVVIYNTYITGVNTEADPVPIRKHRMGVILRAGGE